jgi:hypothetical protein
MEVHQVDFRDVMDDDSPQYRVCFWSRPGRVPEGVPVEKLGFHATEYEISDARSVYEVLAWAEAHSGPERTFCVYVLPQRNLNPDTEWMHRLAGVDPTNVATYGESPDGYYWDSTDALGGDDESSESG